MATGPTLPAAAISMQPPICPNYRTHRTGIQTPICLSQREPPLPVLGALEFGLILCSV